MKLYSHVMVIQFGNAVIVVILLLERKLQWYVQYVIIHNLILKLKQLIIKIKNSNLEFLFCTFF